MSSSRPTRPGSSGSHASSGREGTGTLKAKRSTMDKSKLALARDAYGWPAPAPASSANQTLVPGLMTSPLTNSGGSRSRSPARAGVSAAGGTSSAVRHHIRRSSSGFVPAGLVVGARVFLPATRCYGVVRFFGPTHFASDLWVGVELDTPKGKNSGEVQGKQYFDCRPNYGIFVRPGSCTVLDEPPPLPVEKVDLRDTMDKTGEGGGQATPLMPPPPPQPSMLMRQTPPQLGSNGMMVAGRRVNQQIDFSTPERQPRKSLEASLSTGSTYRRATPGSGGPGGELQSGLLEEKWLVDMLVELVANSDLVKAKISETVKEQMASSSTTISTAGSNDDGHVRKPSGSAAKAREGKDLTEEVVAVVSTALEKGSFFRRELMNEVAASQRDSQDSVLRELEALRRDVGNRLRGLEDKVTEAVSRPVAAIGGGGPSSETVEEYGAALKSIAEAARAARQHVMEDVEKRVQRLAELSAMTTESA